MAEVETVSVVIAAITVVIGVITLVIQSREANRARQTQLFMQLYARFDDKDFQKQWSEIVFQHEWKDFDDAWKKYGPEANLEAFSSYASVWGYFEGIGVLVERKLIDIDLVDDLMSTTIMWYWEKTEPLTKEYRKRINRPQMWEWFEYLYNEMKKREQQLARASK